MCMPSKRQLLFVSDQHNADVCRCYLHIESLLISISSYVFCKHWGTDSGGQKAHCTPCAVALSLDAGRKLTCYFLHSLGRNPFSQSWKKNEWCGWNLPLQFFLFTFSYVFIKCQAVKNHSFFSRCTDSSEWDVRVATARQAALTWMDEHPGHSL